MLHELEIAGEAMALHPWGVVYWERPSMLLISDVHLGKVMHFRKHGAAVPRRALLRNFERLREVSEYFGPRSICFLGDLFHSHINREWLLFEQWARGSTARLELVCGNHDILSPLRYEALGMRWRERWENGPFLLTHEPEEADTLFNVSGHIHPAVRLAGPGRQQLRLPCFYLRKQQLILPAFGAFTGSHALSPEAGDRIFALAGDRVIALEEPARGPRA